MKYINDFNQWAKSCYNEYTREKKKSNPKRFIIITTRCEERAKTFLIDASTNKVGVAICHPDDKWNGLVGIGVAYAKLIGKEIPKEIKTVEVRSLRNGQKFTLHNEQYIFLSQSATSPRLYVCERINLGVSVGLSYFDGKAQVKIIE